jgi:uncharacterized protein (TIGR00290 family)
MGTAKKAFFNWSGGKDSSLCLYHILKQGEFNVDFLLTSVNQQFQRVSMHGVRVELLEMQAKSVGLPLQKLMLPEMPSMSVYDDMLQEMLSKVKSEGINYSIFGDIFLEDLKQYREAQLAQVQMQGVFPLWNQSTSYLLEQFIDLGFKAVLVCVNEKYLDKSFAGRVIDRDFVKDLPKNVDPCGEYGEYHTFVYDGPIFKEPVPFQLGEVVYRNYAPAKEEDENDTCFSSKPQSYDTGFWFCDLLTVSAANEK